MVVVVTLHGPFTAQIVDIRLIIREIIRPRACYRSPETSSDKVANGYIYIVRELSGNTFAGLP